jgi:leucyl-tRNA synthetase
MVQIYGADAARIFILFAAPVENELVWNEAGIEGAVRFLQRVYRFIWRWHEVLQNAPANEPGEFSDAARSLRRKTHQTIKRISDSLETLQFNTPVAALMELSNALGDFKVEPEAAPDGDVFAVSEAARALVLMLTPFAPHAAEEMFAALAGNEDGILANGARFPEYREELAKADEIEIPVQVNGKLRSRVFASPEATNDQLQEMALADEKVREYTDSKEVVKVIVVPRRLVNIVVR